MREERKVKKWEEETKMERNKEDLLREEENKIPRKVMKKRKKKRRKNRRKTRNQEKS